MWFLGNASSPAIRAAMQAGELGQMCTPAEHRAPLPGVVFALDNGCFGQGWPGETRWLAWLRTLTPHAGRCLFATAPDVLGDAAATLRQSMPHLRVIRALGYPAALVAQDGLEYLPVPWAEFDVLFLGGDPATGWKLGPAAADLTRQAIARHKTVHMGRVNSAKRYQYAETLGCHSVDGTCLTYAPDTNLRRVRHWIHHTDTPRTPDRSRPPGPPRHRRPPTTRTPPARSVKGHNPS